MPRTVRLNDDCTGDKINCAINYFNQALKGKDLEVLTEFPTVALVKDVLGYQHVIMKKYFKPKTQLHHG
jgi:hypothetical protein